MNTQIRLLFQKLKKVDYKDAFTVESDIFMHLYRDKDKIDIPFVKHLLLYRDGLGLRNVVVRGFIMNLRV